MAGIRDQHFFLYYSRTLNAHSLMYGVMEHPDLAEFVEVTVPSTQAAKRFWTTLLELEFALRYSGWKQQGHQWVQGEKTEDVICLVLLEELPVKSFTLLEDANDYAAQLGKGVKVITIPLVRRIV